MGRRPNRPSRNSYSPQKTASRFGVPQQLADPGNPPQPIGGRASVAVTAPTKTLGHLVFVDGSAPASAVTANCSRRAPTRTMLRVAYLVWIELAGAHSGADGPSSAFREARAPALPRGPRTPWCGFRVVWCLGDLVWPGGPRWRLRRRGADSIF
jgi:hypothetical protein